MEINQDGISVYVELDCLVDTRLSMLYDIDKDMISGMIKKDLYSSRSFDEFGYLTPKVFSAIYSMRNSSALDNPTPTEVSKIVADYCLESTQTQRSIGGNQPVTVYTNVYPYKLTEEHIEVLRHGIFTYMDTPVDVEILNIPYTDITPTWLGDTVGLAIMYDAMKWVNYCLIDKSLLERNIPNVTLLTPALVMKKPVVAKEDYSRMFTDIEESIAPLVDIKFIPTKLFCFRTK